MTPTTGIRTNYAGVCFRSRLEARWAAFFDLVGWQWTYEPFDLDGYIPDFVLRYTVDARVEDESSRLVLVEVKPELRSVGALNRFVQKIEASGWTDEALIVGARLFTNDWQDEQLVLGWFSEACPDDSVDPPIVDRWWAEAYLFRCARCGELSFYHSMQSYACRVHGCHDGDGYLGNHATDTFQRLWTEAGNLVQWRGAAAVTTSGDEGDAA